MAANNNAQGPPLSTRQPDDWYIRIKQNIDAIYGRLADMSQSNQNAAPAGPVGFTGTINVPGGFSVGGSNYNNMVFQQGVLKGLS